MGGSGVCSDRDWSASGVRTWHSCCGASPWGDRPPTAEMLSPAGRDSSSGHRVLFLLNKLLGES